jgi:hypothetical protein
MTPIAKDHFLQVVDHPDGFAVIASKENVDVLQPLFHQYEIECRRGAGAVKDTLVFDAGVNREQVEQILLEFEASET